MKALVKYAAGDSAAPLLQLQKLVLEPLQSDIAEARGLDAVPDGPFPWDTGIPGRGQSNVRTFGSKD